ncbi:tetratricopeptide repeat protein [Pseudomonas mediterranea]|uniref:Flp pilus assembly protein TadD, contains TPR repeats n=1 Tax=Pseudomonas mediterranea TaxID=183795 RepID=A0AAX2D8W9_9PSED|nr:tetratricopeptide repeat protein [Pseudomonas mediterranea]KGU85388.1 TPR repeat-containing protein [Pseudomonas mediterranea CFBP 5447]MBL0844759.1 tetratricopeptide repeat protein [Pseudomonas mediterranea]MDU9030612.1 tetratricopeptide repeat protein [Pseudomonas mediterranea]QHA84443.1 tetratricopeptide repeat protein [Pseudomonas mediterranea]UZE00161.1 tetratricopeptide repeat protein [Pseudomonas mediterranea]
MNRSSALLLALALLSGCQSMAPVSTDGTPPVEDSTQAPEKPKVYGSFSEETIFSLLSAELAGQRNRFDIALDNYVTQAINTQDPGISERAFRIAEYLGADQAALDTAMIWARNAPDDLEAQRAAAVQLARAGRYDDSMAYMEKVLQGKGDTHFDFLALSAADTDQETRSGLMKSFDRLLERHPNNGQLIFGKALLLQQDGDAQGALTLLEDNPPEAGEVAPILLRARLLQGLNRGDEALPLLEKSIKKYPDDKRLRLTYARMLVENNRMDDAKVEFSSLVQQYPEDDELRYSLALVCLEAKAWDEAKGYLEDLIARESHVDSAHLNLGRIAEERNDPESALIEYAQVGPGNDYLPAQLRQADILIGNGKTAEAQSRLAVQRDAQPDYGIQLYLIEAETLSANNQGDKAWSVLQQALKQYPDDLNLLYTRAMLAEKRNDLGQMEKDLRLIIQRDPDNAMALNALGYTLSDRTTRYAEAKVLIEQAHQLNPEDPAVLDSLGWVNFRLGNLDEAERLLRQALERFPDQEVAAHLGEVLWAAGKQREARQIWSKFLKEQPDSPILRGTIKRLTGSETL